MKWLSILAAATVIAACFFPWVTIPGRDMFFGGFHSTNDNFGRPGLIHTVLCGAIILCLLLGRLWSLRVAFFIGMVNIAWALRNYVLISGCRGGECPEKHPALYVVLAGSFAAILFLLLVKPGGISNSEQGMMNDEGR